MIVMDDGVGIKGEFEIVLNCDDIPIIIKAFGERFPRFIWDRVPLVGEHICKYVNADQYLFRVEGVELQLFDVKKITRHKYMVYITPRVELHGNDSNV